jgi:hypothetical protein
MYTRRGAQWRRVSAKGCTVEIEVGVASVAQARVNDLVYQSLQNLLIHLVCDAMAYRDRSVSGRAGAGLRRLVNRLRRLANHIAASNTCSSPECVRRLDSSTVVPSQWKAFHVLKPMGGLMARPFCSARASGARLSPARQVATNAIRPKQRWELRETIV